jgi:hypothetical protein
MERAGLDVAFILKISQAQLRSRTACALQQCRETSELPARLTR